MTYPTISPELTLDFAKSEQLDPRIAFTRSSTATYLDSDGLVKTAPNGVARFEYDSSGKALGLLIEEARTNLVTQSSDLSSAVHAPGGLVAGTFTSSTDSPVQGELSYRLRPVTKGSAAGGGITISYSAPWANGSGRRYSIFVKNNGGVKFHIDHGGNLSSNSLYFEFSTETFKKYTDNSVVTSGVGFERFSNGWYRVFISDFTTDQGFVGVGSAYWHPNTEGDVDVLVCAPQAEDGSFITSYIPTTTSSATRAADVAEITGTNFSDFYNQTEGTIFLDASGEDRLLTFSDGTANNRHEFINPTSASQFFQNNGGVNEVSLIASPKDPKNAAAYALNDYAFSAGGSTPIVDTLATPPTVDRVNIGSWYNSTAQLNGHISRLTYYSERVSNASLQELTS